jgi:putative Flp pilus-assembly TadE/G-like protein
MTTRADTGQASVELVALLPLLLVIGLVVFSVVAAHSADEEAGAAAEAAALALIQGGNPHDAAVAALPEAVRPRATIAIRGRRVHVHVRSRVPLPGLSTELAGDADSDAGPGSP